MDILQAFQEIERLRSLYDARQITPESFTQAVNQLQIHDAAGSFWHVDGVTLRWYRYNGQAWIEQAPPLPPVPPTVPANVYPPTVQYRAPQGYYEGAPQGYSPAPGYAAPPRRTARLGLWIGLGAVVVLALGAAGVILSGCLPTNSTNPAPTPSATPAAALIRTATQNAAAVTAAPTRAATLTTAATAAPLATAAVPLPSATLAPAAATATKAASPVPTQPSAANYLSPAGPWLLSKDQDNVYLIQAKRTDSINTETVVGPDALAAMISPRGAHAAFVTASDPNQMRGFKLNIYDVAGMRMEKVIALSTAKTEPGAGDLPGSGAFEAMRAVSGPDSLAWSEDGRQLAFVGAQDGPSSDLYLYSLDTQQVTRLTDGPTQAYGPSWSPDGKYIVQFGVNSFGTGAGYSMAGAWASLANNTGTIELYKPSSGGEIGLGWANAGTFLVYSFNAACGHYNLRAVTVQPLKIATLFSGCFNDVAFDRASGMIALGITQSLADFCGCGSKVNRGLYTLKLDGTLTRLSPADVSNVAWLPGAAAVWGSTDPPGALAFSLVGKAIPLPAGLPARAPLVAEGGRVWAWTGDSFGKTPGVWIGLPESSLPKVSNLPVSAAVWNRTGTALLFLSGNELFAAPAPVYKPVLLITGFPAAQLAWVVP